MAIDYRVEVQPLALRDMSEAATYVASELKNPDAAGRLAESLVQGIESLASLPTRCPLHRASRPLRHEYRRLKVGSYLIFFSISEEEELVTVARVLYARRNLDKHLD